MSAWLIRLWAVPAAQTTAWALVAGLIGLIWGLSEVIGAFKNETGRALRTGGAWLLLLLNFAASAAIYLLTVGLLPEAGGWATAIGVGLAWPTVFRNLSFKLAQPLLPDSGSDVAAVRLEQAYASVQSLARQLINSALTRQRMMLVTRAVELNLADLERKARLAVIASPLPAQEGGVPDAYVTMIMDREDVGNDIKKALLAAFILQYFDRQTLVDLLKVQRRKTG